MNNSLNNLYMKRTPASTPKSCSAVTTPNSGTPLASPLVTPQATPGATDSDDDRDSVEMSTVTLDLTGMGDDVEDERRSSTKPKLLMPRVDKKEVITAL